MFYSTCYLILLYFTNFQLSIIYLKIIFYELKLYHVLNITYYTYVRFNTFLSYITS